MILYRYILRNHFAPFFFSAFTLMCIFILQFMMKFADRLVGKGLDTWVILKLIAFNLAWMVVLVVPMAALVSTLMAFGNMSQNNEITIIKSSGTSLYKMMSPVLITSIIIGYLLFVFNDDVLPDANHQAKVLGQDISRKKPTLSLEPGIFSQEVPNYAILARDIDQKTGSLGIITLYDYTNPVKINIVTAKEGKIYFSKDQTKLIMDLQKGEIHESDAAGTSLYRKLVFEKHRIAMNADQFSFQQSAPGGPRGERELSTVAMNEIVDSLLASKKEFAKALTEETEKYFYNDSSSAFLYGKQPPVSEKELIYIRASEKIKTAKNVIVSNLKRIEYVQGEINKYDVEIYKKYTLPVACIVFVLIGAPLGTMTRKGGFGVAASISLFFFLIYWAFLIGGEKLAERNFFSPFWGMWSANLVIGVAGIILTYKAVQESVTINFDFLKKIIPKNWRPQDEENNGNL